MNYNESGQKDENEERQKDYTTHCQMFQKVESDLPAKI